MFYCVAATKQETCDNCISVRECTNFMKLLENAEDLSKRQALFQFLRTQQCGFQDSTPKICCVNIPNPEDAIKSEYYLNDLYRSVHIKLTSCPFC